MDWGTVIKMAFVAYLSVSAVRTVVSNRKQVIEAYRNFSLKLLLLNLLVLPAVIAVAIGLITLSPTVMGWSWLSLFGSSGTNINTLGSTIPFFGILFCLLLMAVLPIWAKWEEEIFREGTSSWYSGVKRSIAFGLVHMIVGIPFGAAIALIVSGLFFTKMYFKGGVKLSTQAHFQYNLIVVTGLLASSVVLTLK